MQKLIFICLIGFGAWQWQQGNISFSGGADAYAFDESGRPLVQLITFKNCGQPCQVARKELKRRKVPFNEYEIDPNNSEDPNTSHWKKLSGNRFPLILAGDEKIVGSGTKPQMATMLGRTFGEQYLTGTEKRYFKQHFYSDGSPKIVMYGTDWCPGCRKLRGEFSSDNVDYLDVDVEKRGDTDRLLQTMEIGGYPATWVGFTRVNGITLSAIRKTQKNYN